MIQDDAPDMHPGPLVRDARPTELPRLLTLFQQLSEGGAQPEDHVRAVSQRHRAALAELLGDPRCHLIVLEAGRQVRGCCVLYVLPNLSHGGAPFGLVENVIVDEPDRGRGYGKLLMAEVVRRAKEAGCYKVTLTSNLRRAAAHRFYERLGFQHTHKGFTRHLRE